MCDFGVSFFPLERNVILSPVQCQTIILHKTKKIKRSKEKLGQCSTLNKDLRLDLKICLVLRNMCVSDLPR